MGAKPTMAKSLEEKLVEIIAKGGGASTGDDIGDINRTDQAINDTTA